MLPFVGAFLLLSSGKSLLQGIKRDKIVKNNGFGSLILLTVLQGLICLYFWAQQYSSMHTVLWAFSGLVVLQWLSFLLSRAWKTEGFSLQILAFFLCSMGFAVICSLRPMDVIKQLLAVAFGVVAYYGIYWIIGHIQRSAYLEWGSMLAGLGLLLVVWIFGYTRYGAKNWLALGPVTLQPSELVKICFVYAGAAGEKTLGPFGGSLRFSVFAVFICGILLLMRDLGTAVLFFVVFLVIMYLRTGNPGIPVLGAIAMLATAMLGLKMAPHALRRLMTWGHIWDDPYAAGYQQTQALMVIASGALFGVGPGQGRLKDVFAADSDLVFASLCEELGLILGLLCILAVLFIGLRGILIAAVSGRLYALAACGATAFLLLQMGFNMLGTVDILPLTGLTFPFVSKGGSSMVSMWSLMAFLQSGRRE